MNIFSTTLKEIFNDLPGLGSKQDMSESYIEMLDILTTLRDSGDEMCVKFLGDDTSYPSVVTAINAKHRVMVIDNAIPASPTNFQRGRPLVMTTMKQGREIVFNSEFIEPLVPDYSLGYQVSIPKVLGSELPRGALRLILDDLQEKVLVTLHGGGKSPIDGVVKNISRSGLGLKTYTEVPDTIENGSETVACKIVLKDEAEINCSMEIRNVQRVSNGKSANFIGGRMFDISRHDNNLLRNFITQLQYQHLESMI